MTERPPAERRGRTAHEPPTDRFYEVLHRRRDVRSEFTGEPSAPEALQRVLAAAHSAPSVGLSQPWDFVLVRDDSLRRSFREHVLAERGVFHAQLNGERAETFARIKVEGSWSRPCASR